MKILHLINKIINWIHINILKIKKHKHPFLFFIHLIKSKIIFLLGDNFPFILTLPLFKYRRNNYYLHYAQNQFSKVLYTYPDIVRHPDDEVFLSAYLKSGDNYIDIGANIGTTTLTAALAVGDSGQVIAYEAHPETFKYLIRSVMNNVTLISRITLHNVALGQERGYVNFSNVKGHDDINHVMNDSSYEKNISNTKKMNLSMNNSKVLSVPMTRLDDELSPSHIDLIKIDVEGYELQVFKGANKVLNRTDAIFFEVFDHNSHMFNYESKDVLCMLCDVGFIIFTIDIEAQTLYEINIKEYKGSPKCENMIAVRSIDGLQARTGFKVK